MDILPKFKIFRKYQPRFHCPIFGTINAVHTDQY